MKESELIGLVLSLSPSQIQKVKSQLSKPQNNSKSKKDKPTSSKVE
jgi:hypothetical protein